MIDWVILDSAGVAEEVQPNMDSVPTSLTNGRDTLQYSESHPHQPLLVTQDSLAGTSSIVLTPRCSAQDLPVFQRAVKLNRLWALIGMKRLLGGAGWLATKLLGPPSRGVIYTLKTLGLRNSIIIGTLVADAAAGGTLALTLAIILYGTLGEWAFFVPILFLLT